MHDLAIPGATVFDGKDDAQFDNGPGQRLDRFPPARNTPPAGAAR